MNQHSVVEMPLNVESKVDSTSDSTMDSDSETSMDLYADAISVMDSVASDMSDIEEDSEEEVLQETAALLIQDFIDQHPMYIIQPTFHTDVVDHVLELMQGSLPPVNTDVYAPKEEEVVEHELRQAIEGAFETVYKHVYPRRSCSRTGILQTPDVKWVTEKIQQLRAIPQPNQRTPEWYAFRHKYLTASSLYKVFGSDSVRNQLIFDKCKPLNIERFTGPVSIESPMHWGQKYEPMSIMLYEERYRTKVSDFGCLPHPWLPFLAASPDGINTVESSLRYGRMLEVKNIVNRDIDGIPKLDYWVQMQGQMEVCGLNECDFLETRFKEYEDEAAFVADHIPGTEWDVSASGDRKGVMMLFLVENQPKYVYAPLPVCKEQITFHTWEQEMMALWGERHTWIKNIYWRLDEMSCILVLRNEQWFQAAIPLMQSLWDTIVQERETGYAHRAPKSRTSASSLEEPLAPSLPQCRVIL